MNPRNKKIKREESIVVTNDMSEINECYNSLKDNLLYMSDDESQKVIQIESSFSGEGKTTVACNLAVSLSFNKKKVLVIDLDFRRPRVHRAFGISKEEGLVDYISEKVTYEQLIKSTKYEGVNVITRGSAIYNPSFLLTSARFKELIERAREEFDFIILDSPPVLQLSDYIHISKVSDGVLFIVAYGKAKRSQLRDVAALFKKDNIKVIGSVMTFVNRRDPYSHYYGTYRSRYGYDNVEKD